MYWNSTPHFHLFKKLQFEHFNWILLHIWWISFNFRSSSYLLNPNSWHFRNISRAMAKLLIWRAFSISNRKRDVDENWKSEIVGRRGRERPLDRDSMSQPQRDKNGRRDSVARKPHHLNSATMTHLVLCNSRNNPKTTIIASSSEPFERALI